MKTIEELEQERQEKLAENKRRAEIMLGAEYVIKNGEVVCNNVEYFSVVWVKIDSPLWIWDINNYRLIPKPEMVDLDFEDVIVGEIVMFISKEKRGIIETQDTTGVRIYNNWYSYTELREQFTRPDGSRFEKEKNNV